MGVVEFPNGMEQTAALSLADKVMLAGIDGGAPALASLQQIKNLLVAIATGQVLPQIAQPGDVLGTPEEVSIFYAGPGTYWLPTGEVKLSGDLNMLVWDKTNWGYLELPVSVDLSGLLSKSAIEAAESKPSINKQNPAHVLNGFILNDGVGTYNPSFAGKVLYVSVVAGRTYTVTGYTWPAADQPLIGRFEDVNGVRTGIYQLPASGKGAFTPPANSVKFVYGVQRSDNQANIKPYDQVMILEGDRTANTPAFVPYGTIIEPNPRATRLNGLFFSASFLENARILSSTGAADEPVSRGEVSETIDGKGFGVPIVKSDIGINKQNPADKLPGLILNDGAGTFNQTFAGYVYFASVNANTVYTIGGYIWPSSSKPLIARFEDASGARTGIYQLPLSGIGSFTTPANTVKIIYSIERHDVAGDIKPYGFIMLLEGNRIVDYPQFEPYLSNVNKRVSTMTLQGAAVPLESKYIEEGIVTKPSTDPNSVLTKKELAAKKYGVPVVEVQQRLNKQNPANKLPGLIFNDGQATFNQTFAGFVYFAEVLPNTVYTIGGYTWPAPDKPLIARFENSTGGRTGFVQLPVSGLATFTTPANTVKIIYSIERHDVAADIKPYNGIMLLEGNKVDNYPAFEPYIVTPAKQIKKMVVDGEEVSLVFATSEDDEPTDVLSHFNADRMEYRSNRKAVFTFIFDDLNTSDEAVYNVFKEFGFRPSFAIITNRLTSDAIKERYRNYWKDGCSLLNHSVSHPDFRLITDLTVANTQMVGGKKALQDIGVVVSGFVTPYSVMPSAMYPLTDRLHGYSFVFASGVGAFNITVAPNRLSRFSMQDNTVAQIQAKVDTAIANAKLVVFYGHQMPDTNFDETKLRAILTYVKEKHDNYECMVLNSDDAIKTYYTQTWSEKFS